jgi:hypothetical protein
MGATLVPLANVLRQTDKEITMPRIFKNEKYLSQPGPFDLRVWEQKTYWNLSEVLKLAGLPEETKVYFNDLGDDYGVDRDLDDHNCHFVRTELLNDKDQPVSVTLKKEIVERTIEEERVIGYDVKVIVTE